MTGPTSSNETTPRAPSSPGPLSAAGQGRTEPRLAAAGTVRPADGVVQAFVAAAAAPLFGPLQRFGVRLFVALFGRFFHTGGVARPAAADDWKRAGEVQRLTWPTNREWR